MPRTPARRHILPPYLRHRFKYAGSQRTALVRGYVRTRDQECPRAGRRKPIHGGLGAASLPRTPAQRHILTPYPRHSLRALVANAPRWSLAPCGHGVRHVPVRDAVNPSMGAWARHPCRAHPHRAISYSRISGTGSSTLVANAPRWSLASGRHGIRNVPVRDAVNPSMGAWARHPCRAHPHSAISYPRISGTALSTLVANAPRWSLARRRHGIRNVPVRDAVNPSMGAWARHPCRAHPHSAISYPRISGTGSSTLVANAPRWSVATCGHGVRNVPVRDAVNPSMGAWARHPCRAHPHRAISYPRISGTACAHW